MKHLNDILNEGILNVDDNEKGMDEIVLKQWFDQHSRTHGLKINKDFTVDMVSGRITIEGSIPSFIKINSAQKLKLELIADDEEEMIIPDGFLPQNIYSLAIETEGFDKLVFETKKLCVSDISIQGSLTELVLPKKLDKLNKLNLEYCRFLANITNLKSCLFLSLPTKFVHDCVVKTTGVKKDVSIYVYSQNLSEY
jgi:hypothetical protein